MTHPYLQRLNTLQSPQWRAPFPDTMLKIAHSYALQFKAPDPESDAQEALAWLWQKLPQHLDLFVTSPDTIDEDGLLRWSRTVIRNKLHELRRRASREPLTSAGELDLEHFNTSKHSSFGQDNGPPSSVETLLIERDKLLLLLSLILQKPQKVELILGRMAGFSPEQLSSCLPYARDSVPVIVCNWKSELLPKLSQDRRPVRPMAKCMPDQDIPLFTGWTPRLTEAFRDLSSTGGFSLLTQLMSTSSRECHRYLARMAGFWDAVVADVWEEMLPSHRFSLEAQRELLELLLKNHHSSTRHSSSERGGPPARSAPDRHVQVDALFSSPFRIEGPSAMSQSKPITLLLCTEIHPQVQALLERAQQAPVEVLIELLDDPDVLRGLARGQEALRAGQLAGSSGISSTDLLEALWLKVRSLHVEMSSWLEPIARPEVLMRNRPSDVLLALRAGKELLQGRPDFLLVWQMEQSGITPLRTIQVGDSSLNKGQHSSTWVARFTSKENPVRLLLIRVPAYHLRLALLRDRDALAEANLAMLLQELVAEAQAGIVAIQWLEV